MIIITDITKFTVLAIITIVALVYNMTTEQPE